VTFHDGRQENDGDGLYYESRPLLLELARMRSSSLAKVAQMPLYESRSRPVSRGN